MNDWKATYPTRESRVDKNGQQMPWPFMGYVSEMVNLALVRDDPEGFVGWMKEAGLGRNAMTFDNMSMEGYCDMRGAVKCKAALNNLEEAQEKK